MVYSAVIAALVVLPLIMLEGRPGAFLQPLATAYLVAVVAATVVALTLTPALGTVLPAEGTRYRRRDGWTRGTSALLTRFTGTPVIVAALVGTVIVIAGRSLPVTVCRARSR